MFKKAIKIVFVGFLTILGSYILFRCDESKINTANAYKVRRGMTKGQVIDIMGNPDEVGRTNSNFPTPYFLYNTFPPFPLSESPVIVFFDDSTSLVKDVRLNE